MWFQIGSVTSVLSFLICNMRIMPVYSDVCCVVSDTCLMYLAQISSAGEESPCNAGDPSSIPELGSSPGEGIGSVFLIGIGSVYSSILGLQGGSDCKESSCNVDDLGSVPGLVRSSGGGHGNPLQYSFLESPHGQRSLVGYSLWGHKESDMTKHSVSDE